MFREAISIESKREAHVVKCPPRVEIETLGGPGPLSNRPHADHRSVTDSTLTAIYERYRYDKEKRAALAKSVQMRPSGDVV